MKPGPEDIKLLTRAALEVERRQMTAPLIMLLEMHRPLSFVVSSFLVALGPLIHIFFSVPGYQRITELLEDRDNGILFMDLLEKAGQGRLHLEELAESEQSR
jgi:hypothetical protein